MIARVPRVTATDAKADPELRDALCEWMRGVGLDPDVAAAIEFPTNRTVDVEEYVLTETGARQLDPERPDTPLKRWRRVRVSTPPPATVVER